MYKLKPITNIPTTTPMIDKWCLPYFSAVGKSSSSDIKIIMPAMADSISASNAGLQYGSRKKNAINAPKGSASPDANESQKAFFLLPVA